MDLKVLGAGENSLLESRDVHIHFPAGAVPKDGPSAGVTLVTSLVSLFSQKNVRADTAMTGEMTLRGLVLPVGGIKDKVCGNYVYFPLFFCLFWSISTWGGGLFTLVFMFL